MKRTILNIIVSIVSIFCLAAVLQAQQPQAKFTLTPVAGQIYMLQGDGGNIGVLADPGGVLLIDSMYQRSAPSIREAIKSLPGGDKVRFLINTHWHSDHTEGNLALGPGAIIIAHENVRALLAKPQALLGQQSNAYPAGALPSVTYSNTMTLYVGNEPVRLVHYPNAHSNGDTVVYLRQVKSDANGRRIFSGHVPIYGCGQRRKHRKLDSAARRDCIQRSLQT